MYVYAYVAFFLFLVFFRVTQFLGNHAFALIALEIFCCGLILHLYSNLVSVFFLLFSGRVFREHHIN